MQYTLKCSLILGILTAGVTTGEARVFQRCAEAFKKPEPFLIKTEQQMRDEGYREKYIAGLDHARSNLELAHLLRTSSIDPITTHIEEFADLIDPHIAFIERVIHSQNYSDPRFIEGKALRLGVLERLKFEAQMRKDLGQVDYQWWFFFNLRLAAVATTWIGPSIDIRETPFNGVYSLGFMTNDGVKKFWNRRGPSYLVNDFPKRILIPTIQDLGYIAINETYGTGVHLIGLVNDSSFMHPIDFSLNDINHATRRDIDQSQMAKRVMQKKASLPKHKREAVEWIFFDLTHEASRTVYESLYYYVVRDKQERGIPDELKEGQPILIQILKDSFWESNLSYIFPWLRI